MTRITGLQVQRRASDLAALRCGTATDAAARAEQELLRDLAELALRAARLASATDSGVRAAPRRRAIRDAIEHALVVAAAAPPARPHAPAAGTPAARDESHAAPALGAAKPKTTDGEA